jgi:hypothetical protein
MRNAYLVVALVFALLIAACGGSSSTSTPTVSGSSSATGTTAPAGGTSTEDPAKSATPVVPTSSVAATAPGTLPPTPITAGVGTPAVQPDDLAKFLDQFSGRQTDYTFCTYNPGTGVADCAGVQYGLAPPVVAQDVQCTLWSLSGTPKGMTCVGQDLLNSQYYEIK